MARTRYIPEGAETKEYEHLKAVVYLYNSKGDIPAAIAYSGRRTKPDFHYRFQNETQRDGRIDKWVKGLEETKAYKDKRQAERKAFKHDLEVGSILYTSWGWEQTNVEFYEVVEIKSTKTVVIREIAREMTEHHGSMSGSCKPCPGQFIGEAMTKRVSIGNSITLNSVVTAWKWDGTPCQCSWYG